MSLAELYAELMKGAEYGAKALLGFELVHESPQGIASGYIVEAEAYHQDDPASHTFKGKTLRNSAMFGAAGTVYVYFTYGMHYCVNIVTGEEGSGEGVLLRALEPKTGIALMQQRRGVKRVEQLTNGPAKLVQALGIEPSHNNTRIDHGPLYLLPGVSVADSDVTIGTRIGISKSVEELKRYYISDNKFVSR